MNKKTFFFLSFILMVSFSAGVFVRFLTTEQISLSAGDVSFVQGFWSGCKSDILMTACAFVLSMTIYTVPFVMLLVTGQVFSLGFSAAWLLSAHPQGLPIVCAVLLPRCLLKLPAYLSLVLLSLESAKSRRRQKHQRFHWYPYLICLSALMLSSLLEAVLHLLIVSP